MSTKTFNGGIHPPERKGATAGTPALRIPLPKELVVPVNQHFGAPNRCLVAVGDSVKKGQKIADGDGRMNVPVHAPAAGTVKRIEPRPQSNNADGPCVVIETAADGETEFLPPLDGFSCTKEEAIARVREAGLVGMGGAGFPVHVKLAPPPNAPIDLVIANGAECEPYLTTDEAVLLEDGRKVIEGLAIVMRAAGVAKGVIAIEENKARAAEAIGKLLPGAARGFDITVRMLRTKYPQGGEKMLITALTGREVPSGGLPSNVGCLVQNVGTLKAVAEAFAEGKPLIERGLTVAGGACASPRNLIVPIGTLVEDLPADLVSIDRSALRKIVFGGPMMGSAVPHLGIPVQKNSSGVLLMDAGEAKATEEGPCIRCGRCMRACSCRLSPVLMNNDIDAGDLEHAADLGLLDCIECGGCSYSCPARIQLVQRFRVGKQLLRNKRAAAAPAKG